MLLQQFKKYIATNYHQDSYHESTIIPIAIGNHLLLAVSGGVDSVVMVDLFAKAGFNFSIAHCNFQLRGDESERDEVFVIALGEKYQKKVFVKRFDTSVYAADNKISIQVAARQLRYAWFNEIVDSWLPMAIGLTVGSSYNKQPATINLIATAHHADDNVETLLLNFFRGCGITGLHGILPKQGNLIRPLLFAKRDDIIAYANEQQLTWVDDSSNASNKYSRNFIRHQIIPLMQTIYPQVTDNLLANIERFKEVETIYQQSINQLKTKLLEVKGNEVHIPILKLQKQQPLKSIVHEIIKDYGFEATQVGEVIKLLTATNGSFMASATHRLIINRNWLIIAPIQSLEATNIIIEAETSTVAFIGGKISLALSTINQQLPTDFTNKQPATNNLQPATSNQIATLNADAISFPLLLRPYKTGDYFYPLGMTKKKKLSKFFIDLKLSKTDKEKIWVIESDKRIVWVVGYRIDNRFKVTPNTKEFITICLL